MLEEDAAMGGSSLAVYKRASVELREERPPVACMQ
jgi:hypothetical protein